MFARKIVPVLLVAGAVHMMMRHSRPGCEDQPAAEGERQHGPHSFAQRGEWRKRVPPMFEMWHKRAHDQAAQQPAASTPAI